MGTYPLLGRMVQDMETQSDFYKPTSFWQACSEMIIKDLQENGIENFRSLNSSVSLFVPTYAFPGYLQDKERFRPFKEAVKPFDFPNQLNSMRFENFLTGKMNASADYRTFIASSVDSYPYTDSVSESSIGRPLEQFEFDGRKFSRSFLNYLLGINFLKKNGCTDSVKTIMEIGGGFGTLGEILLGDDRNDCFYINADIPPLAFVSTYYLKQVFGQKAVAGYSELHSEKTLEIEQLKKQYKALDLCAWQVPRLQGKIDLFVNFISFQEMEPNIVENYCNHIRRLTPEYILLRNMKEGKKKKGKLNPVGVIEPILGDDYDRFLPGYRLMDKDTTVFGYVTDDGFHSELRLYKRM